MSGSSPADVLAAVERSLRGHFGVTPGRASVTFVGVEPVEVLRFDDRVDAPSYVTLGMSRQAMVGADQAVADGTGPRAELMIQARGDVAEVWRQLAVLAAAPAVEGVVYREGMTVDLGAPLLPGSRCTGGLVVSSALPPVVTDGIEVAILQLVPATSTELAWCRVHGATALRDRWSQQKVDLLDLGRRPAHLD